MDKDFVGTIMPALMVHLFGLTLPFFEAVIGALLIVGLLTRVALVVGALLIAALVFGMTVREQFMIVALLQIVWKVFGVFRSAQAYR